MNSIKEVATNLIEQTKDFISYEDIINKLEASELSEEELKVRVYTDLTTNGEFFFKDGKFNLKKNFTMYEISTLKSEYAISEIEEDVKEEEEEVLIDKEYEDSEIDIENIIDSNLDFDEADND